MLRANSNFMQVVAVLAVVVIAVTQAQATTYTWTLRATGNQDWTTAGNWSNSTVFVSGSGNELSFSIDAKTPSNITGAQTINNVPLTLSMNILTLGGVGPNSTDGLAVIIGDNTSTWTIGDGATSTVNLSNITGSGTGFGDRDLRYTVAANLELTGGAGGITTFSGESGSITGANFSGNITETTAGQAITKSGRSLLIFSGNNSYSGATSVNGGTLRLSHANALPGGIGTTGGTSALTISNAVVELGATDFSRGFGTGISQFQITGGVSGFSAYGGPRKVTVNGDAALELQWGSTHFAPTTLVLNTIHANNWIELANKIDLNGATRTVEVNANKALLSGDIRTASGTAGLTKTGVGTLVLTGNNTYNGDTTISVGTLSIDAASNIGGSGTRNLIMSGGGLQIRGTKLTSLSDLDSTVTFSATAKSFDIHNADNTFTVDQVLSGTGTGSTLTKSGAGTLVLNQNNTYAGATTISGGGTLVLDYSSNDGSKLADGAALNLSGSTIELSGGSNGEVVNNTVMSPLYANSITRSSSNAVIHLNAITGNNNRNALSLSEGGIATTDTLNDATTGILGGWATVGSHLAINSSNGADGPITAYSGYTDFVSIGSSANTNYQLLGSGSVSAAQSMNTLRIEDTAVDQTLDLGANILTIANYNGGNGGGVLLYAGGANDNYTITGTTGALSPVNQNGQSLGINVYQGTLTLDVRIANTGSQFVKTGPGTLIMNKASTAYTGATYLLQGVTRMANNVALGTTGSITVNAGAALELINNITVGAKALSIAGTGISNGGALRNVSGNNTYSGAITVAGGAARINSDSGTLTLTGDITTMSENITFGGAGDITVSNSLVQALGITKDGAGTLGIVVTGDAGQWTCGDMTMNDSTLKFVFNGAPSETVPVMRVLGNLTYSSGTPTVEIVIDPADITSGSRYPLIEVVGSRPSTLPSLVASKGALKWGGEGNRTLYLDASAQGTVIMIK